MKFIWSIIMRGHIALYRLSRGRLGGRMAGLPVLVLTSTGRRSGGRRSVTLCYFEHDGAPVITASNGGQPGNPGWYFNLKGQPQATIELGDRKATVRAEQAAPQLRDKLWAELVRQSPQYTKYMAKTSRVIPMFLLRAVDR